MLHNQDKKPAMSDMIVAEVQRIVRGAAEPWSPGDSVKVAIDRASRRLGIGYRRARTFWYGTPCAVRAHEADRLRRLELDLLRRRRQALSSELSSIDARLSAREGQANGPLDMSAPREIRTVARGGLGAAGGLVNGAGVGVSGRQG